MFKLETFRLIRKTFKRFISLTLIVLIGTAFMMGLMSSSILMKKSVDYFNNEYLLQDLQIYSHYGFCDEDLNALKDIENVEYIFASKTMDYECAINNKDGYVARFTELNKTLNKFVLIEGRMPQKANECLILNNKDESNYIKLGDLIKLDEELVKDNLYSKQYTVVGRVNSPEHLSVFLGTSNYKNKDLSFVVYIPNLNFISEYYTTMYLKIKDSSNYLSFTEDYRKFIKDQSIDIEHVSFTQQEYLKNQIKTEMEEKINEEETKFLEEKQKGEQELNDAAKRLEEANIQILTYESQISSLQMIINRLKATISTSNDDINNGLNEFNSFLAQYNINPNILYSNEVQEYAKSALQEAESSYNSIIYQVQAARYQYEQGLKEYNEAVLTFNDEIAKAEAEIKKARQDLEDLPKAKWTILDRDSHYSSYMYDNNCKQMQAIGIALPLIFFLVAALVCLTTMKRLIDEQRSQIGIYVALGFTKIQIIGKYVSYALLACFVGCIIGIIIGQQLFPTVIYHTWRLLYNLPELRMSFPINVLLICILSFSLLIGLVTSYVAYNSLKESPALLMRPKSPKNAKEIILEKISLIWDKLSFTSKITARNIFRYKSRFFMTVIGVAGCTGLLIIGWGIKDSIANIVSIQYSRIFNYNYQIYLENSHHIDENIEVLRKDFDNEEVVKYMSYPTKVYLDSKDDTASIIAIDPRDAYIIFDLREKDKTTPIKLSNDGVVVSEKFSINNNIKIGDYITIESINGVKAQVKVSNICEMYFQHYIFIASALYENIFEEVLSPKVIAVKTHNADNLITQSKKLQDFVSISDFSGFINQFNTMIEALKLIILVIIITAGSLAFVVIMNISQVNISERVREIATLKVLGFNNNEINLYIFKEILLLTLIGAILGIPLGTIWHHFIMNVINMDNMMFAMNISKLSFTYAVVLTFVFTCIVLIYMTKPLKQVNMVESLKSVE